MPASYATVHFANLSTRNCDWLLPYMCAYFFLSLGQNLAYLIQIGAQKLSFSASCLTFRSDYIKMHSHGR